MERLLNIGYLCLVLMIKESVQIINIIVNRKGDIVRRQ